MLPDFIAGEDGTKGQNIGQALGVGAAADGDRCSVNAGMLFVDLQQCFYQITVSRDIQLFLTGLTDSKTIFFKKSLKISLYTALVKGFYLRLFYRQHQFFLKRAVLQRCLCPMMRWRL